MKTLTVQGENGSGVSARQRLLVTTDRLPKPEIRSFQKVAPPPQADLESYRIVADPALRAEILASGLGEVVQRPGPGNWSKSKPPAYILKIYPNFDAPSPSVRASSPKTTRRSQTLESQFSQAVVHDLRTKWERYYLETRPERQREHAKAAESADPTVISTRAKELIAIARRAGRTMSSRDAMLEAIDELTSDFETLMRRRHGDLVVDIFGVPEA
jgi:hypothetical protein